MNTNRCNENDELTALLPARFGLDLQNFLIGIFAGDFEMISDPDKAIFLANGPQKAVIYEADPQDEGRLWEFRGWQEELLCFSPLSTELATPTAGSVLVVLETDRHIVGFLSSRVAASQQLVHPRQILRRLAREKKRLSVRGRVILRGKQNQTLAARIHDFSRRGISFVLEAQQIRVGESFLSTIELEDCGSCEVIIAVRRIERFGRSSSLVAASFQNTTEQVACIQRLFQCAMG
ncbi:PilZ domain-containing protein [Acidithiobacillus sp. AMEEHan]|uniref:PilZ domain-containing protein n=1 Tax=Acidithiobacillus sp. AMEEHan TaxID=2994951 RepID=UPI0027E3BF92|nr:PilZ domain-containing protein [Acidithiobacillus sp. AMEEHan]